MDKQAEGKKIFDIEINALEKTRNALDDTFTEIVDKITQCEGKVIVTGVGKSGHVAAKIAATFSSLGTPSFCMHPAEAMHGDLGMVSSRDIVIAISYSGESDEILKILPNIKMIGAGIIAITGNGNSSLAQNADITQVLPSFEEACRLGLAPTSSTTSVLCYGDALAIVASNIYGFTQSDFGKYHPAGLLGKKLILKVDDLMAKGNAIPKVGVGVPLMKAIEEISRKRLGLVSIVDDREKLCGIITDGDLRRVLERHIDIYNVIVDDVMTKEPYCIDNKGLAVDALLFIKHKNINALPIVDGNQRLVGTITWQLIVKAGIVI